MANWRSLLACFCAVVWLPQARSPSAKLQELRAEFGQLAQQHGTEIFAGASQILSRIVKLEGSGVSEQALKALGFAAINDEDYKACASAMAKLAKMRSNLEDGPDPKGMEMVGKFCKEVKAHRTLDAMAWLRLAMPVLEKEIRETDSFNMLQFRFWEVNTRLFSKDMYPEGISMDDTPPNHCSLYHPGLTPRAWHKRPSEKGYVAAARALEENFDRIGREMDAFLANPAAVAEMNSVGRTSCRSDALLVKKGDWRDIGLYKKGVQDRRLCWKYFPHTCGIIERELPEVASCPWGIVSISRLGPGSDTLEHTGNTNSILTMHLGITTPRQAGMSVGKASYEPAWERGKVTLFDDSFQHRVWHRGKPETGFRVVLLIRFWHPDYTMAERRAKAESAVMGLSNWSQARRMELLNGPAADARWKKVSSEFRTGVGIK
jgi:hypothetical protein